MFLPFLPVWGSPTIPGIRQAACPSSLRPSELTSLSLRSSDTHQASIPQARPLRLERSNELTESTRGRATVRGLGIRFFAQFTERRCRLSLQITL